MANLLLPPNRTIIISSEINEELAKEVITRIIEIDEYDSDQEQALVGYEREPIEMFINSGGGSITSGFAIIDCMSMCNTPIITYALGSICSMALPIYLSGDLRLTGEHAEFMYHGAIWGYTTDIEKNRDNLKRLEELQNALDTYVLKNTKFKEKFLKEVVKQRKDYFFDSKEAIKEGVAHEIIKKTRVVTIKK